MNYKFVYGSTNFPLKNVSFPAFTSTFENWVHLFSSSSIPKIPILNSELTTFIFLTGIKECFENGEYLYFMKIVWATNANVDENKNRKIILNAVHLHSWVCLIMGTIQNININSWNSFIRIFINKSCIVWIAKRHLVVSSDTVNANYLLNLLWTHRKITKTKKKKTRRKWFRWQFNKNKAAQKAFKRTAYRECFRIRIAVNECENRNENKWERGKTPNWKVNVAISLLSLIYSSRFDIISFDCESLFNLVAHCCCCCCC